MTLLFITIVCWPILGFIASLFIPKNKENTLSNLAFVILLIHLSAALIWIVFWLIQGGKPINIREFSIYKANHYDFFIDFYFDKITAVYWLLGSLITTIITRYSRYYLHREEGYKRFFNTLLFFYSGYSIIIFSGNFETLFIGWEILGISSFLLIAFYRDRYLPVKNAVKVFSIYRIGDVGLILVMWLSHHIWDENISFDKLYSAQLVHAHFKEMSSLGLVVSIMVYITAAAKSAQLPFSSWLPRAMEGPTPSSAIFYGSLSVHIGAFLLLRTFPFWENQFGFRVFLVLTGLASAAIGTMVSRVQSSIKSQVAYASMGQIGLIFVEIGLGLHVLALIHIAGNAFLRTYQLLISPSVVSYRIKEQLYALKLRSKTFEDRWPKKLENTLYLLSLKEWNLDSLMYHYMWNPIKKIGAKWFIFNFKYLFVIAGFTVFGGLVLLYFQKSLSPKFVHEFPIIFALLGAFMALKAFSERDSVRKSWTLIMLNHVTIAIAISFNEHFDAYHNLWYLSGIMVSWAIGIGVVNYLRKRENWISLTRFFGHSYEHPKAALLFLMACLGLAGFPITPTFIGEDLIFSHIHADQIGLAVIVSFSLIINGLATLRIYARVFLGPHIKNYHGVSKRSF